MDTLNLRQTLWAKYKPSGNCFEISKERTWYGYAVQVHDNRFIGLLSYATQEAFEKDWTVIRN